MTAHAGMWYPPRRVDTAEGLTGGDGTVTFEFDPPFNGAPVVTPVVNGGGDLLVASVVDAAPEYAVVEVRRPAGVLEVLGLSVLGADVPAPGVLVHITAREEPPAEESPGDDSP